MTWKELHQIVTIQAEFAVMRYEEKERRKDKIQELVCQAYELYLSYLAKGKPIDKNQFKQFVTKRCREIDKRSICKAKYGGTSTLDVLSYYRKRPNSPTPVFQYDEIITAKASIKSKQLVDDSLAFAVDYPDFLLKLTAIQKRILDYLIQGYRTSKIAEMTRTTSTKVKQVIKQLQVRFVEFFEIDVQLA